MTAGFLVLGILASFGLALLILAVSAPRPGVTEILARYEHGSANERRLSARIGHLILRLVPRAFSRPADLAVVGRTEENYAVQIGWLGTAGAGAGFGVIAVLPALGCRVPPLGALVVLVIAASLPVALGRSRLRAAAKQARREFRRALACWLELVALAQAGGMGVEGALHAAVEASDAPGFLLIREALHFARHAGESPWAALQTLGEQLGVSELVELAATVALSGTEGAWVRSSLAARSASLRRRELADAETEANATTERLFVPSVILMLGFLVYLGYPAVTTVSHVL